MTRATILPLTVGPLVLGNWLLHWGHGFHHPRTVISYVTILCAKLTDRQTDRQTDITQTLNNVSYAQKY